VSRFRDIVFALPLFAERSSMKKEVLINAGAGEIRVAIVEDGRLQELFSSAPSAWTTDPLRKRADAAATA
jgi:hypothetical protein